MPSLKERKTKASWCPAASGIPEKSGLTRSMYSVRYLSMTITPILRLRREPPLEPDQEAREGRGEEELHGEPRRCFQGEDEDEQGKDGGAEGNDVFFRPREGEPGDGEGPEEAPRRTRKEGGGRKEEPGDDPAPGEARDEHPGMQPAFDECGE